MNAAEGSPVPTWEPERSSGVRLRVNLAPANPKHFWGGACGKDPSHVVNGETVRYRSGKGNCIQCEHQRRAIESRAKRRARARAAA